MNKGPIPEKSVLTIRLLIGCYLLYIDYSVIKNVGEYGGFQKFFIIACLILFFVVGVLLIVYSTKYLMEDWRREKNGDVQNPEEPVPQDSITEMTAEAEAEVEKITESAAGAEAEAEKITESAGEAEPETVSETEK